MKKLEVVLFSVLCLSGLLACQGAAPPVAGADLLSPGVAVAGTAMQPTQSLTKIVFIGKAEACECTRKRIDGTYKELQEALGTPARLPVEMLLMDKDEAKVEVFSKQRPMLTLPALYFVDGQGKVLDLLQGELTAEQIKAAITARP